MNTELVSIIMPSYNTARYIGESIQSVQDQTYKNWELIIVDDCSSDNTDEVVAEYMEKDSRIIYLKNKKNSGAAVSRNKALKAAKGKWIAFLDSDDLWNSDKLKKQILFMETHNYHFSYTEYAQIDENSNLTGTILTGPEKVTKAGMYCYCWPGCLTVMYDKDTAGLIQIENIRKNNDYAMWLKVIKKADCYLLKENLASYRKRSGSISNHGYMKLVKWHYRLYRIAEKKNVVESVFLTMLNLVFGVLKKIVFKKEIKEE